MKQEKSVGDVTINTRITNIRTFFNYCFEKGYIPPFRISLMRIQKTIKLTYSDKELETLLIKPDLSMTKFQEYRNWFAVVFFYDTGVRIKTLVNILIEDLLFDRNKIAIRTQKNRQVTYIHMSPMLKECLQEYLSYRKRTARRLSVLQRERRAIDKDWFAWCYEEIQPKKVCKKNVYAPVKA